MKTLALVLAGMAAMTALGVWYASGNSKFDGVSAAHEQFLEFKLAYGKAYGSMSEHYYRFQVFQANLKLIAEVNADPQNTYSAAVNEFADKTFEELSLYYLTNFSDGPQGKCTNPTSAGAKDIPQTLNWAESGKVQAVKNQKMCGSCWAFSAAAAIESALAIKTGALPNISEQELVDCSKPYGNEGCNGGLMNMAFDYVIDHSINSEDDYPYRGADQNCKTPTIGEGQYKITGCVKAEPTIQGLVNAIAVQPVSVGFHVTNTFFFYHGGVYNPWFCVGEANHGVLAVGYDQTASVPYYIVKNSWGSSWGDKGYFKIAFGKGEGTCKIAGNGLNYYPLA